METRSNKFLVLVVTGFLLGTLLIFTLWLFDARDGDGNPYMIRFTGSVAGLEKGSPVTFSGVIASPPITPPRGSNPSYSSDRVLS